MSEDHQQVQVPVEERIITLKVKLPEVDETLEIPCSINDALFDIIETLKVLQSTSEYTSYVLKFEGKTFGEETIISELIKDDEDTVSISLIPSAYNDITARKHLIAVRELAALESKDEAILEISGACAGYSTFEDLNLDETIQSPPPPSSTTTTETKESNDDNKEESKEESKEENTLTVTEEEQKELSAIASEITNGNFDLNIVAAKPNFKLSPALRSLSISQWSPADISRKVSGDLFYLQVQTLEGEIFNITAHVGGFYVNNSSNTRFDNSIHSVSANRISKNYSLVSLLKSLSPLFSKQIEQNKLELSKRSTETYYIPQTTTLSSPWLIKELDTPTPDLGKSQYNLLHGGIDGSDLQIDWNKDYQLIKDLGNDNQNLPQRINREQSLISTSSSFTTAAIKGAMAVVRGEISPVNPDEESCYHIYLRNGIFYSKAIDSIGQFKSTGGAEAARSTVGKDVSSIKNLNRYDINGVHSLLTTVVDYLGHRIVCQAPVPGIFQDVASDDVEPIQTVKYGFIDDHSDVVADESFVEQFKQVGEAFHLKPHKIWNDDGSKIVDVVTSGYTKGTKGSDNRSYIIDLFRTTPLDIEFIESNYNVDKEDSYPHRETLLRHEAINEWIKRETAAIVKKEAERLEKEGKSISDNKETIGVDNSLFLLNPDAFSLTPAPTPELAKELKDDEDKVREVSKFVSQILIPEFIKEMEKAEVYNAIDGVHLTAIIHEYGINVRYLGKIAQLAAARKAEYLKEQESKYAELETINKEALLKEEKKNAERKEKLEARVKAQKEAAEKGEPIPDFKEEDAAELAAEKEAEKELSNNLNAISVASLLESLYKLSVSEMIARATKHFLRKELESIPLTLAPYVISHVHNCLLASSINPNPDAPTLNPLLTDLYNDVDLSILERDAESINSSIAKEVFLRFRFKLPENWVESINTKQLLRSVALKFGIQWKNRDYAFSKEALAAQVENQIAATETIDSEVSTKQDEKHSKKKKKRSTPKATIEIKTETSIVTTTFVPEDIVSIVPVSKNSIYESTAISDTWEAGLIRLSSDEEEKRQEGSIYINQSVEFAERLYGSVHNITASYLTKLGNLYSSTELVDSVILFKKAFQSFERCSGADSYQAALSLNQLANVYLSNKQVVNAAKIYKRLLQYWILAFGEYHPNVLNIYTSFAVILSKLGMIPDAINIFNKIVELSDKINGESSQQSAYHRYQLAQILLTDGNYKEALSVSEISTEAFKNTLGLNDISTVETRKFVTALKRYNEYMKHQAKNLQEKEKEARKLEQEQNIKHKQALSSKQVTPDPEIANKSIDDIVAFIDGTSSNKKKKNNKKKNSKK
ncbi:Intracellular distribution of mitochondria [Pichia californica]|uniref:Intracellular distribution of mitochondria n=1 Tax=Pichia californica TaxID=460514 RepID=A0A9P7BFM2_9ASCO|nr:Intracellular distribution of mitochondria [[Candida] californica]